jgi:hypothetical protein
MAEIPDARKYETPGQSYSRSPSSRPYGSGPTQSRSPQPSDDLWRYVPWIIGGAVILLILVIAL